MIHDEAHFETLTALAVGGQLSEEELLGLEQHAAQCSACCRRMAEMEAVSLQLFIANAVTAKVSRTPGGMQERFLERAIEARVPLNRRPAPHPHADAFRFAPLVIALLLTLNFGLNRWLESRPAAAADRVIASNAISLAAHPAGDSTSERKEKRVPAIRQASRHERRRGPAATMQNRLLPSLSSNASSSDGKRSFRLDPAYFSKISHASAGAGDMFAGLHLLAVDSFSGHNQRWKLQMPGFSTPILYGLSGRKEPGQRVFAYNAMPASLSFPGSRRNPGAGTMLTNGVEMLHFIGVDVDRDRR